MKNRSKSFKTRKKDATTFLSHAAEINAAETKQFVDFFFT
jgi:hypothetical protein